MAVVEQDPTYAQSSTTLSAANLRTVAFSLKENFLISKRTFEILETFESDMTVEGQKPGIYFRAEGNLFLCDADGPTAARGGSSTMHESLGSNAEWLESDEIHAPMAAATTWKALRPAPSAPPTATSTPMGC
ncbi:MAG: hypothetical protein MZV70_65465 [Desulfobacterales bacterium]|nr:hypothetical protein [Desulfobacterales bacterium]